MDRDHSKFGRVHSDHVWAVYGFLAYRTRAPQLAEDLTQATFERALRAWPRFDPAKASERTWLLAIARNLWIDHTRRRHEDVGDEIVAASLPAAPGPETAFSGSADVHAALAQLGQREREIIARRFGGDFTGPEIAEMLDLSVENVQQILSRTLRHLRQVLDDDPQTPVR